MHETILRRLRQKNLDNWGKPDLILIDGGKGQLDAALQARDEAGKSNIPFIGLAKREEQIVIKNSEDLSINAKKLADLSGGVELSDDFTLVNLPNSSHIIKLLQRIRDESHRFAVSYHSVLKKSRQTKSVLDDIPGIGPKTRSKLIRKFGSVQGIKKASEQDLASVVGVAKSKIIINFIQSV